MSPTSCATCFLCEACCGILVEHEAGVLRSVRGDPDDEFSRGHICPKGVALMDVQHDPDRLRMPVRRVGSTWEEIGWEEALSEAAARIAGIQNEHGRDAVALYAGNPTVHSYEGLLYSPLLWRALGSRNRFSAHSVDALPRLLTSFLMYGSQAVLPVADLDRTQHILILGANPVVSNGSVMTAPDCKKRLETIMDKGGKVVVIDPRRSETARIASEHHFVRPGSDALLLLAMVEIIFREDLTKRTHLRSMIRGWEEVERATRGLDLKATADAVGIDAETITRLAREFAASPSAVAYGRMGISTQRFGAVTTWLIDVLNIITGNLDRAGGAMFATGAVDVPVLASTLGQEGGFNRYRSRVSGLPEFGNEFPVAALAEEMETPGQGQIRALIVNAGNPTLSLPNGRRLEKAIAKLDFVLSIDIYLNETSRHADIILPPTWGLENDHYPLVFGSLAIRNHAKFSPALLHPRDDTMADWEIFLELATRIAAKRMPGVGLPARLLRGAGRLLKPRGILATLLRTGPYKGLSMGKLARHPHGIDLGPLKPRLPDILRTDSRQIELAPPELIADLTRVRKLLSDTKDEGLVLIGRRSLRSNNSWMHNSERLVKGRDRCTLLLHPDDAKSRGLSSGDRARIETRVGEIEAPVETSEDLMPGVVSLPHGWGHDRAGVRLQVAGAHPGVSINDITDDAAIDPVSGVTHFSGVPTQVTKLPSAH